jgi:hypothetical protein
MPFRRISNRFRKFEKSSKMVPQDEVGYESAVLGGMLFRIDLQKMALFVVGESNR